MSRRRLQSGPLFTTDDRIPSGVLIAYGAATAPSGWLLCDGAAVSRTTYADLFAIIGTAFGTGDGSTTFNVPDCRGRYFLGKDDMGGTSANRVTATQADNLGQGSGLETHVLTTAEMPAHSHTVGTPIQSGGLAADAMDYNNAGESSSSTGGGGAHNNISPYQTAGYIIKT